MSLVSPPLRRLPAAPRWRQRWRTWWLNRLPRRDRLVLTHRNLYILPTRAGLMLAVTLMLLLVGSINYQLNLGYLLTFLLAGCGVVGLHLTHLNLRGLELSAQITPTVFAGQPAPVRLRLHNPTRRARYGVGLCWLPTDGPAPGEPTWCDVAPQSDTLTELSLTLPHRGRHSLPALLVETRFPLGTTRAWHWWRPATPCLVYPAPETAPPPLPWGADTSGTDGVLARHPAGSHDMDGVRPYRRGDPLKWVVWKKVARTADGPDPQWISRDGEPPPTSTLWLDAHNCGLTAPEARWSRLCAWVLEAERQGLRYGLRLPGQEVPPGHGPDHQHRCLEALACA